MDVNDIVVRVKRRFGDESGVQLNDNDIIRWINDAQHAIVLQNPGLLEKIDTTDLIADQDEYPFPTDLLILRSLRVKFPSQQSFSYVQYMNLQDFDQYINGWDGTFYGSGQTLVYTAYEDTIFLFPRPNENSTDGLKILYSRNPVDVTSAPDIPDVPLEYHNSIVVYCIAQAEAMDENQEFYESDYVKFQTQVGQLTYREKYDPQETYPTISVRWEDML